MANTYTAGTRTFDIKSADISVAGLTALKGSAPASDDICYVSEGYRVTIDSNCSMLQIYLGDNAAGTAAVKTGYLTVTAILTLFSTTLNGGLLGEGTTSTLSFIGTAGAHAGLTCNTPGKISNAISVFKVTAQYADFVGLYLMYQNNAANIFEHVTFTNFTYGLYSVGSVIPASMFDIEFIGCANAWYMLMSTTAACVAWINLLWTAQPKYTETATGTNVMTCRPGISGYTSWIRMKSNTVPMWDEHRLG